MLEETVIEYSSFRQWVEVIFALSLSRRNLHNLIVEEGTTIVTDRLRIQL